MAPPQRSRARQVRRRALRLARQSAAPAKGRRKEGVQIFARAGQSQPGPAAGRPRDFQAGLGQGQLERSARDLRRITLPELPPAGVPGDQQRTAGPIAKPSRAARPPWSMKRQRSSGTLRQPPSEPALSARSGQWTTLIADRLMPGRGSACDEQGDLARAEGFLDERARRRGEVGVMKRDAAPQAGQQE